MNGEIKLEPTVLLEDEPVRSHLVDELGLIPFAEAIACSAIGTQGPLTIGVFGKWGVGKTSVLRQASSLIKSYSDPKQADRLIIPVWFNAWKYEREEHPIVPLIATVHDEIERAGKDLDDDAGARTKELLSGLKKRLRQTMAAVSIDTGLLKIDLKEYLGNPDIDNSSALDDLLSGSLYYKAFQCLDCADEIFPDPYRVKIVIFIDDLDRCQPDRALRLLESIKLVLSQPGYIFVLALDNVLLESYLDRSFERDHGASDQGAIYLEKMIQLPLSLPPHHDRFGGYISRLLKRPVFSEHNPDVKNVVESLQELLSVGSDHNPRSFVRLVNNLIIDRKIWISLDEEVNKALLGVCAVSRVFHHHMGGGAYAYLVNNDALCEAIARSVQASGGFKIKQKEGDSDFQRRQMKTIEQRIESHPFIMEFIDLALVKTWLTNHELRKKAHGFLQEQRPQTLGDEAVSQQDLVENEMRASLGLREDQPLNAELRKTIESIDLRFSSLTDAGLAQLEGLTSLKTLYLMNTAVTDAGMAHLRGLTSLKTLELERTAVTDAGLAQLAGLTSLETLDLMNTAVTDAGLAHLRGLTSLEWLNLQGTAVTDAGLTHLMGLTSLYGLSLGNTAVTDPGLAHLEGLTSLEWLYLQGTAVTDAGLAHLRGLTSIEWLNLQGTAVTDAGLAHLEGLASLETLSLMNTAVTDAGLVHLEGLTSLETLDLVNTAVTDVSLAYLRGLTSLKTLHFRNTAVTDAGLAHLAGLTSLETLDLMNTAVTDAGLAHLEGLASLETLDLMSTAVTDAGLAHLEGLASLALIYLQDTAVTVAGQERLQKSIPNCLIEIS